MKTQFTKNSWLPLLLIGFSFTLCAATRFPAGAPAIQLTSVSGNRFVPGDNVTVSFTTTGVFDSTNQFSLVEGDKNNNAFEIGRVVSSKPAVKNEDFPVIVSTLLLRQPIYNCQTGAITFRVEGGDGTAITFSAPGITRSLPTDPFGVVEPELRRDPKTIPITATQSGFSVTYNFNLKAYCEFAPQPIVLTEPGIADRVFQVNKPVTWNLGLPFSDPTITNNSDYPPYYSIFNIHFDGLPGNLYSDRTTFGGRNAPYVEIFGTPHTLGTYRVTVTGSTAALPDRQVTTSFTVRIVDYDPYNKLTLVQPNYDCRTGTITFLTSGGDGTPISFTAPGITKASLTDNFGIVEQELRNDPKPILIEATQSGLKSTYLFDFKVLCANYPVLILLPPTYDCQSGAIHFNTAGGNGSRIEYMAVGITGWTTNPDQFVDKESRTVSDVQPFILMARQRDRLTTSSWNLKSACGRARMGAAEELPTELTLTVLGNPVQDQVRVQVQGLTEPSVQLQLSDLQGKLIESRRITSAQAAAIQIFSVNRNQSGVLILQAVTDTQTQSIRIVNH